MGMWNIDPIVQHWFWWAVTAACVLWYSTVTVYVAIKGVSDIRRMLRRLSDAQGGSSAADEGRDD